MSSICVVHGDIKPSNRFVTINGIVKLGYFGSAWKLKDYVHIHIPGNGFGTLWYAAPEVVLSCFVVLRPRDFRLNTTKMNGQLVWLQLIYFTTLRSTYMALDIRLPEDSRGFVSTMVHPDKPKAWHDLY